MISPTRGRKVTAWLITRSHDEEPDMPSWRRTATLLIVVAVTGCPLAVAVGKRNLEPAVKPDHSGVWRFDPTASAPESGPGVRDASSAPPPGRSRPGGRRGSGERARRGGPGGGGTERGGTLLGADAVVEVVQQGRRLILRRGLPGERWLEIGGEPQRIATSRGPEVELAVGWNSEGLLELTRGVGDRRSRETWQLSEDGQTLVVRLEQPATEDRPAGSSLRLYRRVPAEGGEQ